MSTGNTNAIEKAQAELATGMQLAQCRQCGCMQGTLDSLTHALPTLNLNDAQALAAQVVIWAGEMQPTRYACLGCAVCYPGVAQNALTEAFPLADLVVDLSCAFQDVGENWPPVIGEYFVVNRNAPVAISTLGSPQLAQALAAGEHAGVAIVGKTETENIGIDKIIKNVITNPAIRFLLVVGAEPQGHQSGDALLCLAQNGVDKDGRIMGAAARRPVLRNVSQQEIEAFRQQVQVVDMRGCEDLARISTRVTELAAQVNASCNCDEGCATPCPDALHPVAVEMGATCTGATCACSATTSLAAETIIVSDPGEAVPLDKAGYFVILPIPDRQMINVEHYAYDHTRQHVIEGSNARTLYLAIIDQGWLTELSHAAYVGKELTKAELSLRYGFRYVQDGA